MGNKNKHNLEVAVYFLGDGNKIYFSTWSTFTKAINCDIYILKMFQGIHKI